MRLRRLHSALLIAALVTPGPLRAQPAPSQQYLANASELKKLGDAAMDALRFEEAISAYARAYALSQDVALLYNLGRAHQVLGRWPEALDNLERFDRQASAELKGRVPGLAELLADVRAHVTTLGIACPVPGARVTIRGVEIGLTPLPRPLRLASGVARVEVTAAGRVAYARDVSLPGGGSVELEVLLPTSEGGTIVVRAEPSSAEVLVDGSRAGNVPAEVAVAAGEHRLVLRAPGYDSIDTTLVVRAGERREVALALPLSGSVTSRWWFWTAIGVVAAAGATTAIVIATRPDPGRGTIEPGQVRGPLVSF